VSDEVDDVEGAVDEVYGSDLDDFVAARNRLAKSLRDAGRRDEADRVAKLRKPSVGAWVLNQLSRTHRRDVDLLLDAGHRLREAQAGVLGGADKSTFEKARKTEADAIRRLTREAEKRLRTRGAVNSSVLAQIAESLRAAAISPTGRELLARGRFTQPSRSEGFDIVSELAGTSPSGERRPSSNQAGKQAELRDARAAVKRAKESLKAAERDEREARRHADRLGREADAAGLAAAKATARVEQAAENVRAAEARLKARE
jgi:hypothetical protein